MKRIQKTLSFLFAVLMLVGACVSCKPNTNTNQTSEELKMDKACFSFKYGGRDSKDLLEQWPMEETKEDKATYTLIIRTWTDPESGVSFTQEMKSFKFYKGNEWVLRVENTGNQNTKQIKDLMVADFEIQNQNLAGGAHISYAKGTDIRDDDFLFVTNKLSSFATKTIRSSEGRSTSKDYMPYFNVYSAKAGYMMAIGWTGDWMAQFKYESESLGISAGMQKTDFYLKPGESVRTPSFVIIGWEGAEEDSYNMWRQFMLAEHTPRDAQGNLELLPIVAGAWGGDTAQGHLNTLQYISNCNYNYDAYWIDAGWFGEESRHSSDQYGDEWFKNAGNWYHNTVLYPEGFKAISDKCHTMGMDFLLWFEPERAYFDSDMVRRYPQWYLNIGQTENTSFLFNMGDPEAREWMTDFISHKIQEYGVDIYRQDFNFDPGPYWAYNDEKNRTGIMQMKYIEGLYLYLEGLVEQNPGLLIDNCAGGGRRLDYEMMSRSLPTFRSDYMCFTDYKTTSVQVQTDGLSHFIPLTGTCLQYREGDTYSFRSNLSYGIQFPAFQNVFWATKMLNEFHRAQPYFTGDYYILTDSDNVEKNDAWYAYQMNRDDLDEGFVLAFRRENCNQVSQNLTLRVPKDTVSVSFEDVDTGEKWAVTPERSGMGYLDIELTIQNTKESKLVFYHINTKENSK